MDVLAHGLWTYAVYCKTKYRFLAVFFGVMPDLVSFGVLFIINLLFNGLKLGKPELSSIPEYVFTGYNFTHSLVIFLIVFLVIYYITREIPWVIGGWLLHILIDIPTHTREFFPTPFLWPLSSYKISGISWGNKYFMGVNYLLLFLVYIYIFYNSRKVKK